MNNKKYFAVAKHLANERFLGVDGFNNFSGFNYAEGAAAQNVQRFNPSTSAPYEFTVTNANTAATDATLFDSYNTRLAANNGQASGITIASAVAGVTYNALLAQSEGKNFECGMTYIQVVSGSNSALTATWSLTQGDANGKFTTEPRNPKISPGQFQSTVLEFWNVFLINGYTKIALSIPASTAVKYSFYPSATNDPGRALANAPETIGYGAPQIASGQKLELSASAINALRG